MFSSFSRHSGRLGGLLLVLAVSVPVLSQTPPPSAMPQASEERRIAVSGRVVMDGGTAPGQRVAIERVCSGQVLREAYTDSEGYFAFVVGARPDSVQDASTPRTSPFSDRYDARGRQVHGSAEGISEKELMHCDLRASLGGYRSSTISLAGRRTLENPDVGTIVLVKGERQDGTLVSVTSMRIPRPVRRLFDQAQKEAEKKNWKAALSRYEQAVNEHPEFAEGWVEVGILRQGFGDHQAAQQAFAKAAEADPVFVKPHFYLAKMAIDQGQWEAAAQHAARVLELDSVGLPLAYYLDGIAHLNLGNLERAETSARRAQLFIPPQADPAITLLLGAVLQQKNDFEGAAENFRTYLDVAPDAANAEVVRSSLQRMEQYLAAQPAAKPAASAPEEP